MCLWRLMADSKQILSCSVGSGPGQESFDDANRAAFAARISTLRALPLFALDDGIEPALETDSGIQKYEQPSDGRTI